MTETYPMQSVLDFGIVAPGTTGSRVLSDSIDLAERLERLGYHRLWLSEHHEAHFCWTAPEIMLAALAQRTDTLLLGSAAALLPVRNPLLLAESFRTLEALYPGRMALGVCAGVPTDIATLSALTEEEAPKLTHLLNTISDRLSRLLEYLHGRFPAEHRFAHAATPQFAAPPPVWVMGSGASSALNAAAQGCNYAYSLFHRGSRLDQAIPATFRERRPNGKVALAISCISADTASAAMLQRRLIEDWLQDDMRVILSGTHSECQEQVRELAERFNADEIILLHLWHDHARRIEAVEAMASLIQPITRPISV